MKQPIAPALQQSSLWAYLQLLRPANILTAWADILVGFAAAGSLAPSFWADLWAGTPDLSGPPWVSLAWLILATTGLYGGGITFNDVFDAELDARERPERPLPSGRATLSGAIALGSMFLIGGAIAAAQVSLVSALLAIFVAAAALLYDKYGKHHPLLGPLNMGLCRGGNLLLGVSVAPTILAERWYLALIPIVYIAAVTAVSRGEVSGGKRQTGIIALLLVGVAIGGLLGLGALPEYRVAIASPFALLFTSLVLPAFLQATRDPSVENVRNAVRAGILSLIVLDSVVAAGFGGWPYGLLVLVLLPLSKSLAKAFAMT